MDVSVQRLGAEVQEEWQEFVRSSNNGTIFHDLRFLSYHPTDRFATHHLVFREGGNPLAVLPAAVVEEGNRRILRSPYGASVGGFVTRETICLEECFALVDALSAHAQKECINAVDLTTVPSIYHVTPHHHLEFALFARGFRYTRRLLVSALDLANMAGDPMRIFDGRMRTSVRKAIKIGITVAESDEWKRFYEILLENKARRAAAPTHTLDELLELRERLPDHIKLYLAYAGREAIAGVLIFVCNPRVATTFYICHLPAYQQYNAVSLILRRIVEEYGGKGFRYLDLGPSVAPDMSVNWGVLKFKESLGTRGYFRDTWCRDL